MWFQRKVPGVTVTALLSDSRSVTLARRIAEALHKLHKARVPTKTQHTMADELKILRQCFAELMGGKPEWSQRLRRVMTGCQALAEHVPAPQTCGIHRDFYPSQVILDGERLWLIDFDLYCEGDPALDAGNFIGHITEQALREYGRADALCLVESALEDRFVELAGEVVRPAVRAYSLLTLARHIFLSTKFPERAYLTERILTLTEKRLGINSSAVVYSQI
jgi:thiamine kinase-like enzyme